MQVHQLKRSRQELADVIEVVTGVKVPGPPLPDLGPAPVLGESGEDIEFD